MRLPFIPSKIKAGDIVLAETATIFGSPGRPFNNKVIWTEGKWGILQSCDHIYEAICKPYKYWYTACTYNGHTIDYKSVKKLEKAFSGWTEPKNLHYYIKDDDRYENLSKNVKIGSKVKLIDVWLPNKFGEEEITDEHYQSGDILTVFKIDREKQLVYFKELKGAYSECLNFSCLELV